MYDKIFVGADPELFFHKDGVCISAHDLVPGTKEEPKLFKETLMQADGVAAEFNIQPAVSVEEFLSRINLAVMDVAELASLSGLQLFNGCVTNFPEGYLKTLPEYATRLGCSPDFNAYTESVNPSPNAAVDFRTAAGHVHVGIGSDFSLNRDDKTFKDCCSIVKEMDVLLGVPSVIIDKNVERRKLYGKAGAMRPKTYGLEYRVLSNFWLFDSSMIEWVYKKSIEAVENLKNNRLLHKLVEDVDIIYTINNSDVNVAKSLVDELELEMP